MVLLTTGLIDNPLVGGIRPTLTFTVKMTNDDTVAANIEVLGYFVSGSTNTLYVQELITLTPGGVVSRDYFAQFDAFEYKFNTSSDAVEVSAWGKNAIGNLVAAHRVLPAELEPIDSGTAGATGDVGATEAGLNAFGYVYQLATLVDATVTGGADVPFSKNGPLTDITHTAGTTTVTVATTGTYLIEYTLSITAGIGAGVAIAVNGTVDA